MKVQRAKRVKKSKPRYRKARCNVLHYKSLYEHTQRQLDEVMDHIVLRESTGSIMAAATFRDFK